METNWLARSSWCLELYSFHGEGLWWVAYDVSRYDGQAIIPFDWFVYCERELQSIVLFHWRWFCACCKKSWHFDSNLCLVSSPGTRKFSLSVTNLALERASLISTIVSLPLIVLSSSLTFGPKWPFSRPLQSAVRKLNLTSVTWWSVKDLTMCSTSSWFRQTDRSTRCWSHLVIRQWNSLESNGQLTLGAGLAAWASWSKVE